MLDWRLMREHLEEVRARLGARAQDIDWDGFHKLDQERRDLLTKIEEIRHKRKNVSDQIAKLKPDHRPGEALMEEMRSGGGPTQNHPRFPAARRKPARAT